MFSFKRTLHKLNWEVILNMLGYVLLAEGCLMSLPWIITLLYQEESSHAFLLSMLICFLCAFPLVRIKVRSKAYFAKDGLFACGLAWLLVSLFGALPFYLSGEIPSYVDCFFEIVSGFTTTGASILTDIEALSHGALFWRSFSHWIGGMGVLVFVLAFLPKSNDRTMHVMRAEVPGPTIGKLVPRLKQSAMLLYAIYMFLTIIMVILLLLGGMPLFDALCNTFGTAGTGGFAIKNISIAAYDSVYFEGVITVFMLLFGINFNLYYFLMLRDYRQVFKNEELRVYLKIVLCSIILIGINIMSQYESIQETLRYASFQVASIITTTGFSTVDFNLWPTFSKAILMLLMICGASAGSTGGGMKVSRLLIIAKKIKLDILRLFHPQKVEAITLDGKIVDEEIVNRIMGFFCCYMFIVAGAFLLISLNGFDIESTITAVLSCISNIGPGLGVCGPMGNFAAFSDFSKIVLSAIMLIGRLEIYPMIIFMLPLLHLHVPRLRKKVIS